MEELVWFVVPFIFFWIASWAFRSTTHSGKVGIFIGAGVLSVLMYLIVRPTCGCIGVDQITGALMLAVPFNFVEFFLAFVSAFVSAFVLVKTKGQ